jgi:nucleoid DNA-binding protein
MNRSEKLNKLELIQALKEKAKLPRQEAYEVVELFFSEMTNAFIKAKKVSNTRYGVPQI